MLPMIAFVFVCVLGSTTGTQDGCPSDYLRQIYQCAAPIFQRTPSLADQCLTVNGAVECVARVMTLCANEPDIATLSSIVNIGQVQSMVQFRCSGGPSPTFQPGTNINCPAEFRDRIATCVEPIYSMRQISGLNMAQACGVVTSGLACLDDIVVNCAGEPDVQTLTSVLNVGNLRNMVQAQCSTAGTQDGSTAGTQDGCPSDYGSQVWQCIAPLLQGNPSRNFDQRCLRANRAVECVARAMRVCANEPGVQAMASIVNIGQARSIIQSECSGGPPPTFQPGTNINCPAGFRYGIVFCVRPIYLMSQVRDLNPAQACGVVTNSLACLDDIVVNCAGEPDVQTLTSVLNVGNLRNMVQAQCSTMK